MSKKRKNSFFIEGGLYRLKDKSMESERFPFEIKAITVTLPGLANTKPRHVYCEPNNIIVIQSLKALNIKTNTLCSMQVRDFKEKYEMYGQDTPISSEEYFERLKKAHIQEINNSDITISRERQQEVLDIIDGKE